MSPNPRSPTTLSLGVRDLLDGAHYTMGIPSIIAALRKAAKREPFSGADSGCQKIFSSLANGRGESPCPILTAKERCETLYSTVNGDNSDCNCDRAFFERARACLTRRSKFVPVLACAAASHTPPYEPASAHMFREVMKPADIPKWVVRDTNDNVDPTSAPQSSHGGTAIQILAPIIVGIVLCLAFALWFLYYTGRLYRLTSILPSMRRSRKTQHRWTIDDDDPNSGASHHVPDAEATPMIAPVLHWRSLSAKGDATDRKRFSTRMGMGVLTPVFSKGIFSIQRLFGRGPIKVSHVPVPDTFDLEDPVSKADPFDTSRSTSSRSWPNGPSTVGRNSGSTLDRIPSPHNLINKPSWSSAALESVLDNGQENYGDAGNVFEDDGANDHDDGAGAGNGVLLISRDGEDFSLSGSLVSVPIGRGSSEVDRRSIEVVPPSPVTINKQPFRKNPSIARSASTPLLCPPPSEKSHIRPLSPSTDDLSNLRFQPIPKSSSFMSPTHFSMRPAASGGVQQPSREDAPGIHLFTTATPPIDHPVGSSPYGSPNMASTRALSPNTNTYSHSRLSPTGYSPSASPDLHNYVSSSPGRSPPGSAYYLPPSSVPVSRQINASDPQNLIPPAVRGAGYNPYQHARSVGAFE